MERKEAIIQELRTYLQRIPEVIREMQASEAAGTLSKENHDFIFEVLEGMERNLWDMLEDAIKKGE